MPNLNAEQHFSQSPLGVDIERSLLDRSFSVATTSKAGLLNVFCVDEILPGDTIDAKTTQLTRMLTPVYPVMDNCYLDMYWFFVPNRLVWKHWKEFCGENTETAWIPETVYQIPQTTLPPATATAPAVHRYVGDIYHQMGIPLDVYRGGRSDFYKVNALPFRGYDLIWSEWFRDQNTMDPALVNTDDTDSGTYALRPTCRVHDLFGSCLPGQQKGQAVKLVFSGHLPVMTGDKISDEMEVYGDPLVWKKSTDGSVINSPGSMTLNLNGESQFVSGSLSPGTSMEPNNLWAEADTPNAYSNPLGFTIDALRLAVQTQKILEKMAIGGSRYTEIIRSMFGVTSPDARQQRPELLGSQRFLINMQEVTQTSATGTTGTPIGTIGAYSKTVGSGCSFNHSFTEHGFLFGVYTVRHNRSYSQGFEKFWKYRDKMDLYWPALAHISEQPVYSYELFTGIAQYALNQYEIFGYQEAWYQYRYKPSRNTSYMDPAVPNSLGRYYTYGDVYGTPGQTATYEDIPTLSASWMSEGRNEINRTLAIQSDDQDQFLHSFYVDFKHTRPLPVYSVPGLVDHF